MLLTILILIVIILVLFIAWLFREIFSDKPNYEAEPKEATKEATDIIHASVIGATKSESINSAQTKQAEQPEQEKQNSEQPELNSEPETQKVEIQKQSTSQVPKEEVDSLFDKDPTLDIEISAEYVDNELIEELENEVISTQVDELDAEDEIVTKTTCLDYNELKETTIKIMHDKDLTMKDVDVINKIEGTDIETQMIETFPNYIIRVSAAISAAVELLNKAS